MGDPRFPILGDNIPSMLGRTKIMQRLCADLTKPTPSHLSVVGPRYVGKSVLLKTLADQMSRSGSPYCSVVLWDLGHQTPKSDEEFHKVLCRKLGEGIRSANADYGAHLLSVDSGEYAEVSEVIDALHADGKKVLMLWDGFDKPLSSGALTRNLWDNLLDLCRKPSFRLVTSTRKELHQLIRDEKSDTSDFWGVFEGIVRVTVLDEVDIETILATLPDLDFQSGGKAELLNWSSGFPPLFLEVLNQIAAEIPSGSVDNEAVNRAAVRATEMRSALIRELWDDCPPGAKDVYSYLVDGSDLLFANVGRDVRACLIEKGFARQSGNKLTPSCRMLRHYLKDASPDEGSMARLFGTWEDYKSNIRGLLERRLAQVSRFDERLHRLVARAVEDIPDFPDDCLNNLTSIEERVFDLIWQREFGQTRIIPQEIVDYWDQVNPDERTVKRLKDQIGTTVPGDRGIQCGLLQLLTGSRSGFESKAKYISKDTYVLINAIHSFRNRSQHSDGQEMHVGVAVAAIMGCLELLSCLDRELAT